MISVINLLRVYIKNKGEAFTLTENGIEIDDNIPEEELDGMDVKAYYVKGGWLTLELGESIADFE